MKGYSPTVFWLPLDPDVAVVTEPENPTFAKPRAPTIAEEEAAVVPEKHNFSITFECPQFEGKRKKPVVDHRGNHKLDDEGVPMFDVIDRINGCVREELIKDNNITKNTTPEQFADLFLPLKRLKKKV